MASAITRRIGTVPPDAELIEWGDEVAPTPTPSLQLLRAGWVTQTHSSFPKAVSVSHSKPATAVCFSSASWVSQVVLLRVASDGAMAAPSMCGGSFLTR